MIILESESMELLVIPEVGGKVGQIRDKLTQREILVPPQKQYQTIEAGKSWLDYDTSGMDDCFPNIAAGRYPFDPCRGIALPDLGEWTHGIWQVATLTGSSVVLERTGECLPYFARKRISFVGDRILQFGYRIENRGHHAFRYMWSAHPLISVPGDFELILPPGDLNFRTFPSDTTRHVWPSFHDADVSHSLGPEGRTSKVFVSGLSEGWCTLKQHGWTLRFTFDLAMLPVLGLWFNNFGFPRAPAKPFRCIAVEPCTSPTDLLDELPPKAYPTIGPAASAEWSFELEISDSSEKGVR